MLDKLYGQFKEELLEFTKKMAAKYEEAWAQTVKDLKEHQSKLENEIEKLDKDKEGLENQLNTLSDELIKITNAYNSTKKDFDQLKAKNETLLEEANQKEGDLQRLTELEKKLEKDKMDIEDKMIELKIKEESLIERERRVKKIFSKV